MEKILSNQRYCCCEASNVHKVGVYSRESVGSAKYANRQDLFKLLVRTRFEIFLRRSYEAGRFL